MVFSKLIAIGNKSYYKNTGSVLRLIKYVLAHGETYLEGGMLKPKVRYYASNCVDLSDPHKAAHQMRAVKRYFKKTDGRQMYHYVLSFDETLKDPKKVYEVGLEIMDGFFDEYQTVFAVHENTNNLHIHFVFNSVSYVTGKKWCLKNKDFYLFKEDVECMANSHFCTIEDLLK